MEEVDWDLKSFPGLLPDGKNSLHAEREPSLSDQDYFIQRIMNKDFRFANNAAFIFAAVAYKEKKQIQRNMGICFKRGTAKADSNGDVIYSLRDPYMVLENIKNTPRYWQKARYELIARLENLGPFAFFFTLSCADLRWTENFSSLLNDVQVEYDSATDEIKLNGQSLDAYFEFNKNKHDFIRKNLLNATLTFHQRVKMFIKHIIMNPESPMSIEYYSYKVEFALRGAGHIHGVLWVDWENLTIIDKSEVKLIKSALENIKNEEDMTDSEKQSLANFADKFISCSLKEKATRAEEEKVQGNEERNEDKIM